VLFNAKYLTKKHFVHYPVLALPDPRPSRKPPKAAARQRIPARALELPELDRLIHERLRLGIVSALATHASLSFNDLKRILKTTDGNLSVHARKLEKAEHISCLKYFEGRVPRSVYRLTATGRRALAHYLDQMEEWIRLRDPSV
jgi:DNA-binding HxlR family transcriptional regulator